MDADGILLELITKLGERVDDIEAGMMEIAKAINALAVMVAKRNSTTDPVEFPTVDDTDNGGYI